MAARSLLLASVVAVPFLTGAPAILAQELNPRVENTPFKFSGKVNAAAVMVRSGPGENYYATARLDKDVPVTVVGIQFDWLKVVPPEGSFSVVAKQFIDRQGESNVGKVNTDKLNVRAGSSLTPVKVTVQCQLQKGDTVTILDQQDEYYKIQPPPAAYVFIHKRFVDPVKQLEVVDDGQRKNAAKPPEQGESGAVVERNTGGPATRPANDGGDVREIVATNANPTTRPAREPHAREVDVLAERQKAEAAFDELENAIKLNEGKALEEQPYAQLLTGYQELLKNEYLPVTMRRMSELRVASMTIKVRAQNEFIESRKQLAATSTRIEQIRAQRQAIERRVDANLTVFSAVGQLMASAVQVGEGGTLYRLVDPKTNRAICYVRSNDPAFVTFVDKFVGVRGPVVVDGGLSLKVVGATEIAPVDPAKVNNGVSAQLIPPSMVVAPLPNTATTNGN